MIKRGRFFRACPLVCAVSTKGIARMRAEKSPQKRPRLNVFLPHLRSKHVSNRKRVIGLFDMHMGMTEFATPTAVETHTTTGICAGTTVLTLSGEMPIEALSVGDRVITRDSGMTHVKAIKATTVHAPTTGTKARHPRAFFHVTPRLRNTPGNCSGRSSAINPGPNASAHCVCNHAPVSAACNGLNPRASNPVMNPAKTSPDPAVASQGAERS